MLVKVEVKDKSLFNVKAVLIDLDGTMLDTAGEIAASANAMLQEFGLPQLGQQALTDFVGKGAAHLVECALIASLKKVISTGASARTPKFEQAMPVFLSHYDRINSTIATAYPHLIDGLSMMQAKGFRLACVTNKPAALAVELLRDFDLAKFFEFTIGGDQMLRKKPDAWSMTEACRRLGIQAHEAIAIGDSDNDAQAARAAGLPVLLVPYGYRSGQPIDEIDCDGVVSDLRDAASLLALSGSK